MGIPQCIVIALYACACGITLNDVANGRKKPSALYTNIVSTAVLMGLLYWGGFFS